MVVPVIPRDGEIAFAVSVATLYDLTIGKIGWPVSLTAHSHPTKATLTLRNRTPGGPVLDIIDSSGNTVVHLTEQGFEEVSVGSWIDLAYQTGSTPSPGAGSNTLRMYSRDGRLYFRIENLSEQEIPLTAAPGPNWSLPFWMNGG